MATAQHYDVIIVGTGAGGGTLAYALAQANKRVLLLERGAFLPRERENWDPHAVNVENRYKAKETWYYGDEAFKPSIHYWVGGNTKLFGAALFRLREADFGKIRHAGGVSPAWPLGYDVFEPYYTRAEHLFSAHGLRGSDPTEPPASGPYPFAPLPHEPRVQRLADDLEQMGLHPFPLPIGVRFGENPGRPQAPVILSLFDGYPDPTKTKADAEVCTVEPALATGNVTLLTERLVERLETDAAGRRVVAVHARHGDAYETYRADIVAVACGAANSAALLLRSANDKHSDGLANSSGLVGCNYMCHQNATFLAISKEPNDAIFQKTLALSDFYGPTADEELPMGLIQMLGKTTAEDLRFESPQPLDGMTYDEMARHSLDFWLQSEDLPDPNNRVTLNQQGNIVLHYTKNNVEAHERLTNKLKSMLSAIGCHEHMIPVDYYLGTQFPFNLAHQAGTMKFGADPQTSVLDLNCKAHDLDNLYVVDASFFPSVGAVNPSLTIIANALRIGDHLLERMR
ncbi:MAG: GMC family oxidoreductase [Chloroflexales bacterium]|nr:GMC family oxidoreductase [Chloroflexales bacterium]